MLKNSKSIVDMISIGHNIQTADDELRKINIKYLVDALRNPKQELSAQIRQLRTVKTISTEQYSRLKRKLPYIVCGIFNPPYRKISNFAYTTYFIIDIDHISEKEINIDTLRKKIESDPRTTLCFVSPGEDGLKVFMRLNERCYDAGMYSMFYKIFVDKFSKLYNIQQIIDSRTCDVTRACFMSMDPNVYYNENSESIDIKEFLNTNDTYTLFKEVRESGAEITKNLHDVKTGKDPDADTMEKIRSQLLKKTYINKSKDIFVPEILNDIIEELKKHIEETGIEVTEIFNIQYGKKIKMKLGTKLAEINLFYGKKGFSVIKSPRTGTNAELNELTMMLIKEYIDIL